MEYKQLFIRSYARSASNFIVNNVAVINPKMIIHKSPWWKMEKQRENSVVVSVLRNPKDVIVSDISMGLQDMMYSKEELEKIDYSKSIEDFKKYMLLMVDNIENIMPFTFEQITENPKKSFSVFLNSCGYKEDFMFPDVKAEKMLRFNYAQNKNMYVFPTSKSLDSYDILYNSISGLDELINIYEECRYAIYKRQLDF
jgi:hypothetical protein